MSAATLRLTEPQALMLEALIEACEPNQNGYRQTASPRQLAKMRWPDSPAWQRRTRKYGTNDPGAVGGTMPMKAATVLWRLHAMGLAHRAGASYDRLANLWEPTTAGRRWVAENRTAKGEQ